MTQVVTVTASETPPSGSCLDRWKLRNTHAIVTSIAIPFLVPLILINTAAGIDILLLPVFARALHADQAVIGGIISARSIGQLASSSCMGWAVAAMGTSDSLVTGPLALALSGVLGAWATSPTMLLGARFLNGLGFSVLFIARTLFVAETIDPAQRGKVAALVVGTTRFGAAVGPALAGIFAHRYGLRFGLYLTAVLNALGALLFRCRNVKPLHTHLRRLSRCPPPEAPSGDVTALFPRAAMLLTVVSEGLAIARSAREILLPLMATEVGMGEEAIGMVTSISFTFDVAMIPVAGFVLDKYGRRAAAGPALIIIALGFGLLSRVNLSNCSHPAWMLWAASILIGCGNGLSNGWQQVVGADIAPPASRAKFLGLWTFQYACGYAVGPLFVGVLAQRFALSVACYATMGASFFAGLWCIFIAPETLLGADTPRDARHGKETMH